MPVARINNTQIFYERFGTGHPLFVMHGLGLDHTYFRPWLDALGERFQLIYYDHRGNGRSAFASDWTVVDFASWVQDAQALRQHLGYERIFLLGHCSGGFLAQEYAIRFGEYLDGLILCSTAPVIDYAPIALERARARGTLEQFETLQSAFSSPIEDDDQVRSMMRTVLPIYFYDKRLAADEMVLREVLYSAGAHNRATFHCLPTFNTLEQLQRITTPTLVVTTSDDWLSPPAQSGHRLAERIPNATVRHLERCGHFPFIETTKAFNEAILSWASALRTNSKTETV